MPVGGAVHVFYIAIGCVCAFVVVLASLIIVYFARAKRHRLMMSESAMNAPVDADITSTSADSITHHKRYMEYMHEYANAANSNQAAAMIQPFLQRPPSTGAQSKFCTFPLIYSENYS
jgi:hypothetical protein